jgi:hypothetical protein
MDRVQVRDRGHRLLDRVLRGPRLRLRGAPRPVAVTAAARCHGVVLSLAAPPAHEISGKALSLPWRPVALGLARAVWECGRAVGSLLLQVPPALRAAPVACSSVARC